MANPMDGNEHYGVELQRKRTENHRTRHPAIYMLDYPERGSSGMRNSMRRFQQTGC